METWRAGTEVVLAGALVVFLYTYLHLHRWHVRYSHVAVLLAARPGAFSPASRSSSRRVAAGVARMSLGLTAVGRPRASSCISRSAASTARSC